MSFSYLIYLYILICIALIVFEIGWLIYYALREHVQNKRTRLWEQKLRARCEAVAAGRETERMTPKELKQFRKTLTRSHRMMAFACAFQNVSSEYPEEIRQAVCEIDDEALFIMKHVARHTRIPSKVYFLKLFADMTSFTCGTRPPELVAYQFRFLTNKSVVCRTYAMNVLYAVGTPADLLRAVHLMSEKELFYHPKLLMEGLMTFRGDHRVLSLLLIRDFDKLTEEYKLAVLEYFRYKSPMVGPFLIDFLKGPYSIDVKCTVLRYYYRHPIPEAKPLITAFLENENENAWEIAAVAAKALSSYPDQDVKELLKKKISHPNWYIRRNAAASLVKIGLYVTERAEIMNGDDQFAKEILEYNILLAESSAGRDGTDLPVTEGEVLSYGHI